MFFIILDLLIFSYLIKKVRFSSSVTVSLIVFLILFLIVHFINPLGLSISNNILFILLVFSMSFFVFYFGKEIAIWFTLKINNNEGNDLLFKWFGFWTDYLIYILILVFQIATIIGN